MNGLSLDTLKLKINQLKHELTQLNESNKPVPELINSTNLLRSNEILTKTNDKKTELLSVYESYFHELGATLKKIQAGFNTLKTTKPRKKPSKKKERKPKRTNTKRRVSKKPRKRKSIKPC